MTKYWAGSFLYALQTGKKEIRSMNIQLENMSKYCP